jgi:hypothetical protein
MEGYIVDGKEDGEEVGAADGVRVGGGVALGIVGDGVGLEVGAGVGAKVAAEHPDPSMQHSRQHLQTTSWQSAFTAIVCGSWQTSNGISPVKLLVLSDKVVNAENWPNWLGTGPTISFDRRLMTSRLVMPPHSVGIPPVIWFRAKSRVSVNDKNGRRKEGC